MTWSRCGHARLMAGRLAARHSGASSSPPVRSHSSSCPCLLAASTSSCGLMACTEGRGEGREDGGLRQEQPQAPACSRRCAAAGCCIAVRSCDTAAVRWRPAEPSCLAACLRCQVNEISLLLLLLLACLPLLPLPLDSDPLPRCLGAAGGRRLIISLSLMLVVLRGLCTRRNTNVWLG
jgi:hypothetical protein